MVPEITDAKACHDSESLGTGAPSIITSSIIPSPPVVNLVTMSSYCIYLSLLL